MHGLWILDGVIYWLLARQFKPKHYCKTPTLGTASAFISMALDAKGLLLASPSRGTEFYFTCIFCPTARKRAIHVLLVANLLSSLLLVARFARCLKLKLLRGASTGRAGGGSNQKKRSPPPREDCAHLLNPGEVHDGPPRRTHSIGDLTQRKKQASLPELL